MAIDLPALATPVSNQNTAHCNRKVFHSSQRALPHYIIRALYMYMYLHQWSGVVK